MVRALKSWYARFDQHDLNIWEMVAFEFGISLDFRFCKYIVSFDIQPVLLLFKSSFLSFGVSQVLFPRIPSAMSSQRGAFDSHLYEVLPIADSLLYVWLLRRNVKDSEAWHS